jgi:molybdopterin synthase catalytic subunit
MMKLRVKLFGSLAQAAGRREDTIELPDVCSGNDVVHAVAERYPVARSILERVSLAVNLEVVAAESIVRGTDEVALLPPVSGGASIAIGLRERPSVEEALALVASVRVGGTAVFLGSVRDHSDAGDVQRLDYEAYENMADAVLTQIAHEAAGKWGLEAVAIFHGIGAMQIGDPTMVVACSAAHRDEAFDACRYVVDEVKRRVPVWKKETGAWGERWVE